MINELIGGVERRIAVDHQHHVGHRHASVARLVDARETSLTERCFAICNRAFDPREGTFDQLRLFRREHSSTMRQLGKSAESSRPEVEYVEMQIAWLEIRGKHAGQRAQRSGLTRTTRSEYEQVSVTRKVTQPCVL